MPGIIAQSVGIDIAKDTLGVHRHPAGGVRRFANSAKGCAALIAWLGSFTVARVAFEPTGAHHHAFERRLAEVGLPLVKVDPRQARRFAEAIGRHAKTDAVDAAMLARFAALLEPPVRPVVGATLNAMKERHGARRALVKGRVAARNRAHMAPRRHARADRSAIWRCARIACADIARTRTGPGAPRNRHEPVERDGGDARDQCLLSRSPPTRRHGGARGSRLPAEERKAIRRGERLFGEIGCDSCHGPILTIDDPTFSGPSRRSFYRDEVFPAGSSRAPKGSIPGRQ